MAKLLTLLALVAAASALKKPAAAAAVKKGGAAPGGYGAFAKNYPTANGVAISVVKTAAADALAQLSTDAPFDVGRSLLFAAFGGLYLGAFQYWYQVNVFKKIFSSTERFTSASIADKLKDTQGLVSYMAQIVLDLLVLCTVYLPAFYAFKATLFSDCAFPFGCVSESYSTYLANARIDVPALIKCWLPADIVCFAIPLYLRLPIRHLFSFLWTIYLSLARGSKE